MAELPQDQRDVPHQGYSAWSLTEPVGRWTAGFSHLRSPSWASAVLGDEDRAFISAASV